MSERGTMFLLLGQATAGPESQYRSGDRHGVLVYVLAESLDAACAIAEVEMPSVGWQDIRFEKGGKLAKEPAEDDPADLGAHRTAMAGGCGIVVYSDPVTAEQNNLTERESAGAFREGGSGKTAVSVGELSTRELQALGALCLAAFCGRFAIVHNAVEELIVHQVSLMAATHLPDWEQAGSRLRLPGRGDPIPEEVVIGVPAELRDSFSRLVDYTVEIGIADIYGAHTDLPRRYLLKAMDVLNAHGVSVPAAELVKVQPRPLTDAWGDPIPQAVCPAIVERCRALLQGA